MLNKLVCVLQSLAMICAFAIASAGTITDAIADEKPDTSKAPKVGEEAADFELKSIDDKTVSLHKLTEEGPVVLIVLRGWPGYHCPLCVHQVADFLGNAEKLTAKKVQVVMVYPGPEDLLAEHAKDFLKEIKVGFPANYHFVLDPEYKFTNAYHVRWDVGNGTAIPSTFIIGQDNRITFARVIPRYNGRVTAEQIIYVLNE